MTSYPTAMSSIIVPIVLGCCIGGGLSAEDEVTQGKTATVEWVIARIEQLGGTFKKDEQIPGKPVVCVNLSRTGTTDSDLEVLSGLGDVRSLNLELTSVTDAGLQEVAGLKDLEALNLRATRITVAGLPKLAVLRHLESLDLSDPPPLYRGEVLSIHEIRSKRRIKGLDLFLPAVTDEGLKQLAALTNLRSLSLGDNPVTDAGLMELAALPRLQVLDLRRTKVTDKGLKHLKRFPHLQ